MWFFPRNSEIWIALANTSHMQRVRVTPSTATKTKTSPRTAQLHSETVAFLALEVALPFVLSSLFCRATSSTDGATEFVVSLQRRQPCEQLLRFFVLIKNNHCGVVILVLFAFVVGVVIIVLYA